MRIGDAYVTEIQAYRMGDRSEKFRVSASYQMASILGSISFEVEMDQARKFWVGQRLGLHVDLEPPDSPA